MKMLNKYYRNIKYIFQNNTIYYFKNNNIDR